MTTVALQARYAQPRWQRVALLSIIGYEAVGCLVGGSFLIAAPDGRLMKMPVEMMHGFFPDFLLPGVLLLGLGILNAAAFIAVLRRTRSDWLFAGLALVGLAIWFTVEIAILKELHWLHFMWGFPVVVGILVAAPLLPVGKATMRRGLLACGILAPLLYVGSNALLPMQWDGYSHASRVISELSAVDAPTRPAAVVLGIAYAILSTAFGWGVWDAARGNRALRVVGGLLIAYGAFNLAPWPPMHQREVLAVGGATVTDTLHIAWAAVAVTLMLLAMGFGTAAFARRFRVYSIATIATLLVFGGLTAADAPSLQANLTTTLLRHASSRGDSITDNASGAHRA